MYGELCVILNDHCEEDDGVLKDAPIIPAGDYTFTVTRMFDFGEYGTCPLNLSFTGTATPASGGGSGGGVDPRVPPDPPPGDGEPPPGDGGGGPSD